MCQTHPFPPPPAAFGSACETLGISLLAPDVERLGHYLGLLLEVNRNFNLTAVRNPGEAWMRHVLDSLSLLPFLADARRIIDVGSGGGLPGIPLAILEPDRSFTLIESVGKKAAFLRQAAGAMKLQNVVVVQDRAETLGRTAAHREQYDLCVSRSVAPLPTLLELTLPLVCRGGRALAMKGAAASAEVAASRRAAQVLGSTALAVHRALPGLLEDAVVVEARKVRLTPTAYPRLPGVPARTPIG